MKILITGGVGYLGSMLCCALEDKGHTLVILDSLVSGEKSFIGNRYFYQGDVADKYLISQIFNEHNDIQIVIHCAERTVVSLSVNKPYDFYRANVVKSLEFFKNLRDVGCKKIILASSAALYDDVPGFLVTEKSPIRPRSPFARTKYISELILKDFCNAYDMKCIALRYFNPIGADPKGRCGMNIERSTNIIARLLRILNGYEDSFQISGTDWETRDGTCIRDYVHIWDAANANVKSVENFERAFGESENFLPLNIGSGVGVTVREFIFAFQNVTGEKIKTEDGERRPGDIGGSYANISRAKSLIGWEPKYTVEDAILDAIRWEEEKGNIFK